jgi:hypothetical protein
MARREEPQRESTRSRASCGGGGDIVWKCELLLSLFSNSPCSPRYSTDSASATCMDAMSALIPATHRHTKQTLVQPHSQLTLVKSFAKTTCRGKWNGNETVRRRRRRRRRRFYSRWSAQCALLCALRYAPTVDEKSSIAVEPPPFFGTIVGLTPTDMVVSPPLWFWLSNSPTYVELK